MVINYIIPNTMLSNAIRNIGCNNVYGFSTAILYALSNFGMCLANEPHEHDFYKDIGDEFSSIIYNNKECSETIDKYIALSFIKPCFVNVSYYESFGMLLRLNYL